MLWIVCVIQLKAVSFIATLARRGLIIMADKVRVNVYLDKEVRSKALDRSRKIGLNFSAFVNLALYEFIKQDSVVQLVDLYKQLLRSEERER